MYSKSHVGFWDRIFFFFLDQKQAGGRPWKTNAVPNTKLKINFICNTRASFTLVPNEKMKLPNITVFVIMVAYDVQFHSIPVQL